MTTELVLLTPVVLLLLGFVVLAGRVGGIEQQLLTAADEAARAGSIRAHPDAAAVDARTVAAANLTDAGVSCAQLDVDVDLTSFHRGGHITVDVTCTVALADVAFAGLPGQRTVSATATEVIDRLRSDP
ncbi:MAG TPA: TadE/TadG family type IV pilus assembly protein [Nitriliruptorales bacterium]